MRAQQVWSGPKRGHGAFLHSPMIDELKSSQAMLLAEAAAKSGAGPRTSDGPAKTISVELSEHSAGGSSERVRCKGSPSQSLLVHQSP
jgi:hypothetical protein